MGKQEVTFRNILHDDDKTLSRGHVKVTKHKDSIITNITVKELQLVESSSGIG
jgi:hypothetical protein